MTKDTLISGTEARNGLISGIRKASQAVAVTMGSAGKNSIIEDMRMPGYRLTNDGISILESIKFADPVEEIGRKILLEAVSRSNKQSGDGSSTACVLTASILEEGLKHLDQNSAMDIKKSLEACIPLIEESINKQKRDVVKDGVIDLELLTAVATISAEDEEIGKRIAEIYSQIGTKGIIHWDISKTAEDYYQIGQGINIEGATYVSPYMCDATEAGQNTNQIRLKNPKILVTKQKLTSASDFNELGQKLFAKEDRDLIVFCDDFEPLIINDLILTRAKRGFRIVLVKLPTYWQNQWFEDIALATGAKVSDPATGFPLKDVKLEDLGTVENIVITKEATHLDGIKDLTAHIEALEAEATDDSKLRASRLNTKTARYFVGGISDSYISHRRYKVEDAISAGWHALNGGIVVGGGWALANASEELSNEILKTALKAPINQISKNMGKKYSEASMELENVYDPAPIVVNAMRNAISVAASILTAETLVLLPREEQQYMENPGVMI